MAPFPPGFGGNHFGASRALGFRQISWHLGGNSWRIGKCNRALSRDAEGNAVSGGGQSSSIFKGFPLQAAVTAGGLSLAGDTIAQFVERVKRRKAIEARANEETLEEELAQAPIWGNHDFVRSARMASYGFVFYGPGSYFWYQFLDRTFPARNAQNLLIKITANQVILGPCVLLVVFAWNFAWMGKLKDLGAKYKRDTWQALLDGWRFWIPAACLNFGVVPLPARVAFMSSCSVFWNFYLSSSIGRDQAAAAAPAAKLKAAPPPA
eukprot:TRINITY_DN24720_c0_g1_i1.p1 TRINITY_DN24720_c0_g1~~TRINITY_DN24720_c0_g1_i1.p1  ORF type:complete len:265 (+),score=47.41 TRINITY_DN24720_c0_g1_i1:150-944(+)